MIYAVIDTNVLVSAIITSNLQSPTLRVVEAMLAKKITPLYDDEIIREYSEVLHRAKFGFDDKVINPYLEAIMREGIAAKRVTSRSTSPILKISYSMKLHFQRMTLTL